MTMKKNILAILSILIFNVFALGQNSWTQMSSLPGSARFAAVSLTINGKAYVGLGQTPDGSYVYDFWEYDPTLNSWTRKADYPGVGCYSASGFTINGKGYVCLGAKSTTINGNDLWEYSPLTNTWQRKADFPGLARYGASAFVIGDTAFVGTGSYGNHNDYLYDMWMYVPSTNTWSKITDFPGSKRLHATSFSIGNYGYIGTGLSYRTTATKDFWKYDKSLNTWIQIPDMPIIPRLGVVSFVIDNKAYVGTGNDFTKNYNDFYEYDPFTNVWSLQNTLNNFNVRQRAIGFSINGVGYVGTGIVDSGYTNDLWAISERDTISLPVTLPVRCFGDAPLTLDAGSTFASYLWNTGETTSTIQVTGAGWYKVSVTKEGYQLTDSVELKVSKPVVDLGLDRIICNPDTLVLNAGGPFKSYLWSTPQTSFTDQIITASKTGIYMVEVTDEYGCKAKDTIQLSFYDRPKLDLSRLDTLYCGTKSAVLALSADKGNYILQRPDIGTVFTGLNAIVPDWGSYSFKFTSTDSTGCYNDAVFKIGFHKIPTVSFSIDSTKCYHYSLAVRYIGDVKVNAAKFTWVFGGDTIANGIGIDSDTITLGIDRNKRDLSLKVLQNGCSNADTIKDIKVIPNLSIINNNILGCAPLKTQLTANNTEVVVYDWDFGDGTPVQRLDNHPTHTFQNPGFYDVKLKVTTIVASGTGCYNEVKVDSMVHVAPVPTAGFTPFSTKCLNAGDYEISYSGSGQTADRYIWNLSGFAAQDIVINPNETKGPLAFNLNNEPKANIRINVISKYGCQSDTATLLVKRKPVFSITASPITGCIPLEVLFTGKISDPVDQVTYTWDLGDGAKGSGNQVNHEYAKPGQVYDIALSALSSITGCSDTISKIGFVTTYPKPTAIFDADHKIVYNDKPTINFLNSSNGATDYLWDFGGRCNLHSCRSLTFFHHRRVQDGLIGGIQ